MNSAEKAVTQIFIATDQQDWERLEVIFANQVELDYSSMNGNPATTLAPQEITSAWKGILPGFTHTHHQLGNMISTIKDNKAEVFCYGTATHFLEDERGNVWTVVGTYHFELALISDEWKVSKMKFNFKYQDGNTSLPQKAIENVTK
ncbi:nuclear transport factor 2 family protein [Flammeovirga sp. EKP202]|uniref:nuclear transport factor 2 family protein n=1 Tax=Flammeovirga sp. EKP202 TaxID=2770592 RepID=UPI00165FB7E8|nr:nuclear transport factor 2 family protein [Flammeovirga sp. EKP202]MBD0400271.1 nuclear transport factor 2 family protein [Flammeovirga sp. EKP202]